MIDDLLTTFRSDVAEPDTATAMRVHALVTRSATRRRGDAFRPRPRLVLGVAAAVLVLVPTAVAFGGQIAGLFEGTPAPPAVSTSFADFNQMAGLSVKQGFARQWPRADVSKAHGVIEIQTQDGPEDMWAAPDDQGGQCYFIDFADDPPAKHGIGGFGGCDDPARQPEEKIDFGTVWTYMHPDLDTVYGRVFVDAATVRVTFEDGSTASLPVVEHLFLGSTSKGAKVHTVTAFDAAGDRLAERTFASGAPTHG